MYTHLLLISTNRFQEHIVLFSIIIYLLYQNKCFVVFYEFEQICSNVQFIPSPIEVREFLLRLLNKIPAQNLFSLHIWQDLLFCADQCHAAASHELFYVFYEKILARNEP